MEEQKEKYPNQPIGRCIWQWVLPRAYSKGGPSPDISEVRLALR